MVEQRYTIIIVPHTCANPRKFQISTRYLSYVLILLAAILVAFLGTTVHYVKVYKQAKNLEKYAEENVQLKTSLDQSLQLTQKLNKKISFLNDISNKLRVMAGLPQGQKKSPLKPGMGGVTLNTTIDGAPDPQRLMLLDKRADYLEKNFADLSTYFQKQSTQLSTTPSILPAEGFISSSFGSRLNPFTNSPDFHEGIDLTNEVGTSVVAPADGVVTFVGVKGNYGQVVEIKHAGEVSTLYGHLEKVLVKSGQQVKRWQPIGLMGNTGRSTGPHLHYEVHVNDQPVNPMPYILNLDSFEG